MDDDREWQPNPFSGAPGAAPPYLAGRVRHIERLERALARFRDFDPAQPSYQWPVLVGPRGTGKTVLLNELQRRIAAASTGACIYTTSPMIDADASTIIGAVECELGLATNPKRRPHLRLRGCCEAAPVAILIDEAHTLAATSTAELLNVAQIVCGQAPLLLTLAGTPHLSTLLDAAGATFQERCDFIGVGRLARKDSRDAIAVPLARHEPPLQASSLVLDAVAEDSGGYAYFVSLWGEELFAAMTANATTVAGRGIYRAAKAEVDAKRIGFYGRRFDEIDSVGLLGVAAALAEAFADAERLEARDLRTVIAHARPPTDDPDFDERALATFIELGYVWRPPGTETFESGIPSFMSYLAERATLTSVRGRFASAGGQRRRAVARKAR